MKKRFTQLTQLAALVLLLSLWSASAWAQTTVSGRITDAETGEGLIGASIVVKGSSQGTITDVQGNFSLQTTMTPPFKIIVSSVGFGSFEQTISGSTSDIRVQLSPSVIMGDEVVISASRRPEKLTESPSQISVLTATDFDRLASFNVGELASKLQGVEFVRTGVNGVGINARGFNNAFNAKILSMTDGRNSMMAGGSGLPAGIMNTVIKEDIERVEVVLGPSSSLYGPNAHNGIVNTLTKDPRKYQGTTVALGAGNQNVVSARLRHGQVVSDRFAFKVTGEYTSGRDFDFQDSVYVAGFAAAVPERNVDLNFRHIRGEVAAYYSINNDMDIIASWGGSINNFLAVNNVGRNQIRDWAFSYAQLRFVSPRWFAQVYNTWTEVGRTYGIFPYTRDYTTRRALGNTEEQAEAFALRPGNQFAEMSQRLNAEVQYNNNFGGFNVIAGLSYQLDRPNTFGTSLVDGRRPDGTQDLITVSQFGGVVQVDREVVNNLKIVASTRLDNHSVFGNLFAPKAALVYNALGGSFRFSYGRAFAAPLILFQSANVFNLVFGNGFGVTYRDAGGVERVTEPLKPEEIGTFEIGYKGVVANKKLFIDLNGYYGNSRNFLSPAITLFGTALRVGDRPVTPASPAFFLTYFNYGEVASYGTDLGLNYYPNKYLNIGVKYSWFGSDITDRNNIKNDANKDGYVSAEEASLNAPEHRAVFSLGVQNLAQGRLYANLSVRWVQEFDFYSGSQIGTREGKGRRGVVAVEPGTNPVTGLPRATQILKNFDHGALGGFTTVDLSAGFKAQPWLTIGAGVSNLFNVEQREFVGSPAIGRLYSAEVRFDLFQKKR
jgi:iron complex outermembrane receptor protein